MGVRRAIAAFAQQSLSTQLACNAAVLVAASLKVWEPSSKKCSNPQA